jgi:hypothetical protein
MTDFLVILHVARCFDIQHHHIPLARLHRRLITYTRT